MIKITVTGETYPIRRGLKHNKFHWNGKSWEKTVGEASLNRTLEAIRPPVSWSDVPSPKITITLESVDCHGKKMHEGELRFRLTAGERARVDIFELFLDEIAKVQVITTHSRPANAEEKEEHDVDEHFF